MNEPSKPFSNGTEYEVFKYNFCEDCKKYVERADGFPALVEDGGCPILDAMEYARFDISRFPSEYIRELRDAKDGHILAWHYCNRFNSKQGQDRQFAYFELMKKAICKDKVSNFES